MAVAIEVAIRPTTGRHYRRARKFQFLFSTNDRLARVVALIIAAMVVVSQIVCSKNRKGTKEFGIKDSRISYSKNGFLFLENLFEADDSAEDFGSA